MAQKKIKPSKIGVTQSDFITLASHQLRTPLSGMKWLLELLEKSGGGNLNKKQKNILEQIHFTTERMIALVNDLLEVSRIQTGDNKLYLQATDLISIIRTLVKEKERDVKKKRLQISFITEQEPFPLVMTEPIKIKQALSNLLSNAISYTPPGGKIAIDLKREDGTVLGKIADTGVGIPKDEQKNVFNRFYRGANIRSMEASGTGLGLYITRAFVEASGGKIWFKSEPNKGTTFFFTLPIVS